MPSRVPAGLVSLAAVVAAIIAVLAYVTQLYQCRLESHQARPESSETHTGVIGLEDIERNRLRVVSPSENALVDEEEIVRGATPYVDRNHYIVVTPATGGPYIQEGPVIPDVGGFWTGPATFGSGELGSGERYSLEVIATRAHLRAGRGDIPEDAVRSIPVNVRRK